MKEGRESRNFEVLKPWKIGRAKGGEILMRYEGVIHLNKERKRRRREERGWRQKAEGLKF